MKDEQLEESLAQDGLTPGPGTPQAMAVALGQDPSLVHSGDSEAFTAVLMRTAERINHYFEHVIDAIGVLKESFELMDADPLAELRVLRELRRALYAQPDLAVDFAVAAAAFMGRRAIIDNPANFGGWDERIDEMDGVLDEAVDELVSQVREQGRDAALSAFVGATLDFEEPIEGAMMLMACAMDRLARMRIAGEAGGPQAH